MTSPAYALADGGREVHSPSWYAENRDAGTSRRSWMQYLCIHEAVAEGLLQQVRDTLKATDLYLACLTSTEAREQVDEQIGTKVADLRPDICCPGLPYDAFLRTIRKIVIRINSDDRVHAREQREETNKNNKRTRKRPRDHSVPDPAVEPRSARVKLTEPKLVEPKLVKPKLVESKLVEPKLVEPKLVEPKLVEPKLVEPVEPVEPKPVDVASTEKLPGKDTTTGDEALSIQHKLQLAFDPELVGVMVRDPEKTGQVHISYLQDLAEHPINIRSCRGIKLTRLYEQMQDSERFSGLAFFDPKQDFLWCKIDGEEYNVTTPGTFEFVCCWQVTASLKRDPLSPPLVKFERRSQKFQQPIVQD
jgi:hypothetical protein